MKRSNNILTIAVVILLLANIGLLIYIFTTKNKHDERGRRGKDPIGEMAKDLNMTDQQQKDFKQLRDDHFKNIRPQMDSLRAAKTAYFSLIKDSTANDSIINAYDQRLMVQQSVIDKMTFDHFRRVRNLFTPEQQPRFDSFVQKMMQRRRGGDTSREK
jgi:Spy/CpxP family protein refolding chaperone